MMEKLSCENLKTLSNPRAVHAGFHTGQMGSASAAGTGAKYGFITRWPSYG